MRREYTKTKSTWHSRFHSRQSGMTLLELVVATGILLTLASAALPIARASIRHQREVELRRALREMRTAIDRYKDAADKNQIRVEVGTEGYPPDLETLVKGVTLSAIGGKQTERRLRFLRKIPLDPMTGRAEWGMRSVQDDADSSSWGGQNVFDVFSHSQATAVDGTRYADW
ncbi:MAG: type II secretion system protein [Acidipila sp.]|nr:type II secretion system protein [Acidipila sp.]